MTTALPMTQEQRTPAVASSDLLHPVAVLCCSKKSAYHSLKNVECYDDNDMDDKQENESGFWRDIKGADSDPNRKMITLLLACGPKIKLRTDTPFGESFLQTEWKAARCHQCDGTEYVPAS